MKIFLILFLAFLCSVQAGYVDCHEYPSPDKKYVAQFTRTDQEIVLVIKNQTSGEVELSIANLLTPILDVQWAPSSESFIVIQHLAGSSLATLIHHNTNGWLKYDCEPSLGFPCKYSVVGVTFFKKFVRLAYGVSQIQNNGLIINFKRYAFDVKYQNGEMIIHKIDPLSRDSFVKLREKEEGSWKK